MSASAPSADCPLCGAQDTAHVLTGYDRVVPRAENFDYVRCARCGLLRQDPLPAPERIPGLYPDDYAPHGEGDHPPRKRRRDRRPPPGRDRLLDVGCGGGRRLRRYRDAGWRVAGIDFDARAVERARAHALEVHCGGPDDAPFPTASFDRVLLHHVIEHVLDPVRFLADSARLLAPTGRLVLVTPNADGLGLRLYGSCWYALEAPRHLMLFGPATLRTLAERTGLRVVRLRTRGSPRQHSASRRLLVTQGRVQPEGLDARRHLLARTAADPRRFRGYRRLLRPALALSDRVGHGEILEAQLAHATSDA